MRLQDREAGRPGSTYHTDIYGEFDEVLKGSPAIAMDIVDKPFDRFIFIENKPEHVTSLEMLQHNNADRDIRIINHDANVALPGICRGLRDLDRAVVFLDPYATEVSWPTIETIANTGKIDCWVLFPLMAISRLMPIHREPDVVLADRLDGIFGGREYWHEFYAPTKQSSFWSEGNEQERKPGSEQIAEAYRERLKSVFTQVAPTRRVLKNSQNSDLFDLFFAASNPRGAPIAVEIADYILKHW